MPTPFMHLQIAERILDDGGLDPSTWQLIADHRPAYYLGNVAPDFQTLTKIPRERTHFYNLPPEVDADACQAMLAEYPELSPSRTLSPAHSVFIAAYCAHLLLDLKWYHEILIPVFLGPGDWQDHRHRFIVHNTLLTYLDKESFCSLPEAAAKTLQSMKPDHWLPFAADEDLAKWRDFLVGQMRPGETLQTVEIYASRLSMSPEQFSENLDTPAWMDEYVFSRVDLDSVLDILTRAVEDSAALVSEYLKVG